MEGYLGETITLHGFSYVGNSVYLFLTGPGLPDNGVTLTNTDLRADQGQFTVVGVDDNQEWSYTWKTSRIANEIDYGTYIVYVTNEPVDKAHLGGTSSYKTLKIFLKDSGVSKVSIDDGTSYTLKPEEHVSTPPPGAIDEHNQHDTGCYFTPSGDCNSGNPGTDHGSGNPSRHRSLGCSDCPHLWRVSRLIPESPSLISLFSGRYYQSGCT